MHTRKKTVAFISALLLAFTNVCSTASLLTSAEESEPEASVTADVTEKTEEAEQESNPELPVVDVLDTSKIPASYGNAYVIQIPKNIVEYTETWMEDWMTPIDENGEIFGKPIEKVFSASFSEMLTVWQSRYKRNENVVDNSSDWFLKVATDETDGRFVYYRYNADSNKWDFRINTENDNWYDVTVAPHDFPNENVAATGEATLVDLVEAGNLESLMMEDCRLVKEFDEISASAEYSHNNYWIYGEDFDLIVNDYAYCAANNKFEADWSLNYESDEKDTENSLFIVFRYHEDGKERWNVYQYIGIDPVLVYQGIDASSSLVELQTNVSAGDEIYLFGGFPDAESHTLHWKTRQVFSAQKDGEIIKLPHGGRYFICDVTSGLYQIIDTDDVDGVVNLAIPKFEDYAVEIRDSNEKLINTYTGKPAVEIAYDGISEYLRLSNDTDAIANFLGGVKDIMKENPALYYKVAVSGTTDNHLSCTNVDMLESLIETSDRTYSDYVNRTNGNYTSQWSYYYMMADYSSGEFSVEFLKWSPLTDIDLDGNWGTVSDLILLQKYLLGAEKISNQATLNADINRDGEVNAFDLALLKREILKGQ